MTTRRHRTWALRLLIGLLLIASASRALAERPAATSAEIDRALARAVDYLAGQQSPDGAWRSNVYPPFKNGDALTPLVLMAIQAAADPRHEAALDAGCAYLAKLSAEFNNSDGLPLAYSAYTAAGAAIVLSERGPRYQPACRAWLDVLRSLQLDERLGWQPSDPFYGGWGYAPAPRVKPAADQPLAPLTEPNLSATVFALRALRAAGVPADAAEIRHALAFVERCQNFSTEAASLADSSPLDDGGFYFLLTDPVRNKAGLAGADASGHARFASYGSASLDGLRALALAGCSTNDPRNRAAWQWLAQNLSVDTHPGRYAHDREAARPSLYYYYCHSLAEVLACQEAPSTLPGFDSRHWSRALAEALAQRQQADGSWVNAAVDVRENDPLVATAFAVRALALCQASLNSASTAAQSAQASRD